MPRLRRSICLTPTHRQVLRTLMIEIRDSNRTLFKVCRYHRIDPVVQLGFMMFDQFPQITTESIITSSDLEGLRDRLADSIYDLIEYTNYLFRHRIEQSEVLEILHEVMST